MIPQPALLLSAAAQFVPPVTVPVIPRVCEFEDGIVHPGFVWIVPWFCVFVLTPSTMSISPPAGQFGPKLTGVHLAQMKRLEREFAPHSPSLQKAGHVPQPVGMCTESMSTRPPV